MTGIEVALAALGITATVAGALVWLLMKPYEYIHPQTSEKAPRCEV